MSKIFNPEKIQTWVVIVPNCFLPKAGFVKAFNIEHYAKGMVANADFGIWFIPVFLNISRNLFSKSSSCSISVKKKYRNESRVNQKPELILPLPFYFFISIATKEKLQAAATTSYRM